MWPKLETDMDTGILDLQKPESGTTLSKQIKMSTTAFGLVLPAERNLFGIPVQGLK